ncbi:hypothetical protein ACSBR1_012086 [Camellia fascicularis]
MVLNLSCNDFHRLIPKTYSTGISLTMIDLNPNKLYRQIPRSLANCIRLKILVFGNNEIEDTFLFSLGDLPKLQVLVLQFNRFHGTIENLKTNLKFPILRIIDLFHNAFSGNFPSKLFQKWNAMKMKKAEKLTFMQLCQIIRRIQSMKSTTRGLNVTFIYFPSQMTIMYSITITSKGIPILYEKIQNAIVVIDLSNNKFKGKIPKALRSLCGLKELNVSKKQSHWQNPFIIGKSIGINLDTTIEPCRSSTSTTSLANLTMPNFLIEKTECRRKEAQDEFNI